MDAQSRVADCRQCERLGHPLTETLVTRRPRLRAARLPEWGAAAQVSKASGGEPRQESVLPDEPLVLPTHVEFEPGNFKPVLSCSHDELIDAAMDYMTRAHEYRQLAEGLSKLASHFPPEQAGESAPPVVQPRVRYAEPASDPQPVKRLYLVRPENATDDPV